MSDKINYHELLEDIIMELKLPDTFEEFWYQLNAAFKAGEHTGREEMLSPIRKALE